MKKFILPLLISLIPIFVKAQALSCDIQINGVSFSTYDLCVGEDITMNGTPSGGTLPYTHLWSGGGSQLSPTNNNPTVFTATTPGTYTIIYNLTDGIGGNCSDQIIITVNPLPNLFTSKNDTVCLGECVNLTAVTFNGDALYWYPGYIGNPVGDTSCTACSSLTINVCPTQDTDYYAMTVISTTGCIRTKKVTIEVCNLTVTANGSPNPICKNDTSCLTATPNGCGPSFTYLWSPVTNIDNPNIATPCVWPLVNTNYCVTVTDNLTGCTGSACFMVTVNPQNPPIITPPLDSICYGLSSTLCASGSGTIFDWSNGSLNTACITVWPTTTTVYTVTMTDPSGCTATASAVVVVNPQLIVNAGPNKWMCYGDSVQLGGVPTASGGTPPYTYNWAPSGGNSSNPWVSPTSTTTFTVTVTDAAGCTATDNVIVTVNPQIIINIAPTPPSLCLGSGCSNLTTTVSGGTAPYTYQWSPCGSLNNCTAQSPLACPNVTTVYTLTVTDFASCTESATVTVTVNVPPTANAGIDQTVCSSQLPIIIGGSPTASGGTAPYTYNWSPAAGLSSSTVSNPSANPASTTTYCVTVYDAVGCTATDCITITVHPSPTADAGTDQTLCQGTCVAIGGAPTASGGTAPYTYGWSPAGSLSSSTVSNPTACPLSTTTYCVTVTDAFGCTASDCVTITVNTATATAVANPAALCSGACSNITATGGCTPTSYLWSTGATTNIINVCPAATTSYTVTVTACNGCTAVATATVTVTTIIVTATPAMNPLCPPACTIITANPGGGTPPYTYQWSPAAGLSCTTCANPTACPATTTTYTVTATDATGCTGSASTTITVFSATASASPNPICSGQCTTVSATGGGTYAWSSGQNTASFIACPASTTTYTVTVTNSGCTTTASVTVNVTTVTASAAPATNPICLGACTNITASPSGPYTYLWSNPPGGTTQTVNVCPASTTTYTVTVTDINGCAGTATTTVTVITASVTGNPMSVCAGDSAMLVATGGGTYQWSVPPGGTNDTVFVTPASTTTYTVTVNNAGCTASANFTVTVGTFTIAATASPTNICGGSGTTVTLGTSMGSSYLWVSSPVDPSLAGQTTLQNPVVTPTQTTTYTVTVTSSGGCTASASVTVNVDMLTWTPLAPASVCAGGCVTISITMTGGTPPYTYAWCCGLGNGPSVIACPLVTTTYTCTITDALSCSDVASVTVTALPLPVITPIPNQSICVPGTATLVGFSPTGISCSWTASPNDPSLAGQQNNCTITVSPTVTTTYCVTITDANGCSASSCSVVTVNTSPIPVITVIPSTTICSGSCVTMTASGGTNYTWSNPPGGNANPVTVCPVTTTTYTVTATQAGCTATAAATVTITVVPTPTVSLSTNIAPSVTICAGTCVTFTANGIANTYDFYVNGFSQQLSGNNTYAICTLTNPSSVYVIASNGGPACNDTSNVITINVNPLPIVTISPINPPSVCMACDGSLGTVVNGGTPPYVSYQWDDPAAQTTPTAVGLCAGSYSVVVTDNAGCTEQGNASLSDPGSPLVTLTASDDSVCVGDCINFTAGGTVITFEFLVNNVSMQGPGASNTFTYCSFSNGDIVSVKGTDAVGCTGTSSIIPITVNILPTQFSITGGSPFCTGGCSIIGLNGSAPGVNYFLYLNGLNHGPTVSGTGAPISFGCLTDTGSYTVVAQNLLTGCQNNMFGWVHPVENPLPTIFSVTGGGSLCAGGAGVPVGISGSQILSDSISYQLIIDGVTQDTTIIGNGAAISFGNWTIPGTYQVVATDIQTTCSDTMTGSATVTVLPIPTQCTVTGGGSYCAGGSGVFIGLSCSDLNVLYQIQYNGSPLGGWINGTGLAMNFGLFTAAGSYSVIAQNALLCSSIMYDTVTVVINPKPNANAGIDATICEGSTTQLNATGAGAGGLYVWTTGDSIFNPFVSPVVTTTYTVTVYDINGCSDNDDVIVNVLPFTYPQPTAADSFFCSYETVNTVLDAGPGYATYLWSSPPGGNTQTITVTAAGCYTVSVAAANGCSASGIVCVQQNPPMPAAVILVVGSAHICQPDSVELYLNNPYYTYDWSSGSENESSIFALESGSYYVTVTDSFGCRDTAGPMNITVDPLPHAIISYVDQDNINLEFDFYNNSLNSTTQNWIFGDGSPILNIKNPIHSYYPTGTGDYIVTLIAYNNCGSDTDTVVVHVHQPYSGLTENSGINNFDLYPNPTKDVINMDFSIGEAGKVYFTMYDALGQELIFDENSYISGEQHKELSLADLSKGVYVLKVSTGKGSFIRRIIKN